MATGRSRVAEAASRSTCPPRSPWAAVPGGSAAGRGGGAGGAKVRVGCRSPPPGGERPRRPPPPKTSRPTRTSTPTCAGWPFPPPAPASLSSPPPPTRPPLPCAPPLRPSPPPAAPPLELLDNESHWKPLRAFFTTRPGITRISRVFSEHCPGNTGSAFWNAQHGSLFRSSRRDDSTGRRGRTMDRKQESNTYHTGYSCK